MEPQETFTSRAMRQSNVQTRLAMKAKPSKIEPEGWGDNAHKVTLQWKEQEKIEMSLSTQRHGTLYRSKEISHMYQEA
jgi:hypothetical protein